MFFLITQVTQNSVHYRNSPGIDHHSGMKYDVPSFIYPHVTRKG